MISGTVLLTKKTVTAGRFFVYIFCLPPHYQGTYIIEKGKKSRVLSLCQTAYPFVERLCESNASQSYLEREFNT